MGIRIKEITESKSTFRFSSKANLSGTQTQFNRQLTGVFCCNRRFSASVIPTKLSFDTFCSDIIVFGVVVEFESDSFSKLPAASSRSTTMSLFTLPGNSNSESRLKLGELKSERLEDDEFGESGRDSTFGFGSIPSGNRNDMGG